MIINLTSLTNLQTRILKLILQTLFLRQLINRDLALNTNILYPWQCLFTIYRRTHLALNSNSASHTFLVRIYRSMFTTQISSMSGWPDAEGTTFTLWHLLSRGANYFYSVTTTFTRREILLFRDNYFYAEGTTFTPRELLLLCDNYFYAVGITLTLRELLLLCGNYFCTDETTFTLRELLLLSK